MADYTADQLTAVQAAVDRVNSWQESAPEGTVEDELRRVLDEVGVEVDPDDVTRLATAIQETEEGEGAIDAAAVLS